MSTKKPEFHIQEILSSKGEKRYSLVDQDGVVWIGGSKFGLVRNMVSSIGPWDYSILLRETPELAWQDAPKAVAL